MQAAKPSTKAPKFVDPMLLLSSETLPEGPNWAYELKLDGYRALAFKADGQINLRSRNDKSFDRQYPGITKALENLPANTLIDGELVALDSDGRPSFNALQNYGSSSSPIFYYVFDLLMLRGGDVTSATLSDRRRLLDSEVLPYLNEPIRLAPRLEATLSVLVEAVRAQGLEGLVAKRLDSSYEAGLRSGAWRKMRVNRGQEFVIGGYTVGGSTFDALIFGYYESGDLVYAARTRNGFTPKLREELCRKFKPLETPHCPFANLPEARGGRWGAGLTAAKMADCRWLRPLLVAQFEFVEWTPDNHLRHSRFIGLRDDKSPRDVRRE